MKLKPIITSALEQDMYKYSMGQAIYHQFPLYTAIWTFKCRNKDVHFTKEMVEEIKEQIRDFCSLRYKEDELEYLSSIAWLKKSYIDFLRLWHGRYKDFIIDNNDPCGLRIEANGSWLNTSMYEIPTLAIVNEVYFRMAYNYNELFESFKKKLNDKINKLVMANGLSIGNFSEFGLRRRLSGEAQDLAVRELAKEKHFASSHFVGTSNVYLAKKYNVTPVGTQAHEYIMSFQGNHKISPAYSNYYSMKSWVEEYGVQNGIALTDTIGTDVFLKDFDLTNATLFSGVRHDSGDPVEWGEKIITHYKKLGIDPKTKTLLFSDSLNFEKADKLYNYFKDKAKVAFGIGTYIANDTSAPALNIVMKTTKINDYDVAKISDTPGKGMCKNEDYVNYLKSILNWRLNNEN